MPFEISPTNPRKDVFGYQNEQANSKNLTEEGKRLKDNKPELTDKHKAALQRQTLAGEKGQPPLTPEEIRLIQEANGLP